MRFTFIESVAEVGLGPGPLGIGALALLAVSPKARKKARSMIVKAIASGIKLKDSVSKAGSSLMQDINQAVHMPQQSSQQSGMAANMATTIAEAGAGMV